MQNVAGAGRTLGWCLALKWATFPPQHPPHAQPASDQPAPRTHPTAPAPACQQAWAGRRLHFNKPNFNLLPLSVLHTWKTTPGDGERKDFVFVPLDDF